MEFFSCDANLVIFFEKIKMFTASLSLAPKDTPLTGKKYKGVLPSRGVVKMKKRMAQCAIRCDLFCKNNYSTVTFLRSLGDGFP